MLSEVIYFYCCGVIVIKKQVIFKVNEKIFQEKGLAFEQMELFKVF
jgi:hypothetical protein